MATYDALIENGWTMREIDEMDFIGYMKVRSWSVSKKHKKKAPKKAYIDNVWPGLEPNV